MVVAPYGKFLVPPSSPQPVTSTHHLNPSPQPFTSTLHLNLAIFWRHLAANIIQTIETGISFDFSLDFDTSSATCCGSFNEPCAEQFFLSAEFIQFIVINYLTTL
jgi:hypothetical protein